MKNPFLLFCLLSLSFFINDSYAQSRCGSQIRHQQILQTDAVYARQWQQFTQQSDRWMQQAQSRTDGSGCAGGLITIPVVIHFEYDAPEAEKACIIALVNSQMDHLNQAYNGSSCNDPSGTQSSSGGCVQFVIANKNHPASSGLTDGQQAILFNSDPCPNIMNVPGAATSEQEDYQTCAVPAWAGYLNLVIKFKIQNGTLGISSFPPESSISLTGAGAQNTVIISSCTFGLPGGASPCSADFTGGANCVGDFAVNIGGTTATHEIGHFFGLPHTFCRDGSGNPGNTDSNGSLADGEGCQNDAVCSDGCQTTACDCDGIADTPAQAYAQFGCPGGSSNGTATNPSTPGTDYTYNNFMDYVDDNCMQCFSSQQATRIMNRARDAANAPKADVISTNCPDGSAMQTPGASCDDGNANTSNDVIQSDGCTCAGTMVADCSAQGGDTDGDGICNDKDVCPNDASNTCTQGQCAIPSEPIVENTRYRSIRIDWDHVVGARSYTIQIRFKGKEKWVLTATVRISKAHISGPERDYEYRIKANCSGAESAYSPIWEFSIPLKEGLHSAESRNNNTDDRITIEDLVIEAPSSLSIQPNPARDELQIALHFERKNLASSPTSITIFDVLGKQVFFKEVAGDITSDNLNISQLTNGLYHLVVHRKGQRVMVEKFIKKQL